MLKTAEKASGFARDVELLRYFRNQLAVLSDDKTLELFKTFESAPFTNGQARPLLGTSRQATWERLSRLAELGFVEKQGHHYRVSPSGKAFVSACSGALRGLLTDKVLVGNRSAANELISLATRAWSSCTQRG